MQTHAYTLLGSACLIACGVVGAATLRGVNRETLGALPARLSRQAPAVRVVDQNVLREFTGVYQWGPDAFLYLQMWDEFAGFGKPSQLVAFDESGEVRTLYPVEDDRFFAGPGAAVSTSVESHIEFQRDSMGKIVSLRWRRANAAPRAARRVEIEKHEHVRFSSGDIQLAGTLIRPAKVGKIPIVILVHGSGAENRDYMLPWARFLIRRGIGVLAYDKRGVGGSSGDWNTASFDDLAGDVVAAYDYLKTRTDIDASRIGLLGISQAGWVMPLAATRAKELAFLISISGPGVSAAETTIDQTRNEMTMAGMPAERVAQIVDLLKLQYEFARTGQGWDEYAAAREKLAALMGPPPETMPGQRDAPWFGFIRRLYFYDPQPALRQLRVPTLGIWGALDSNVMADKNKAAWEAALSSGGNRDYTFRILPKANHSQFLAKTGSNREMPTLQQFVPEYFSTIQNWLAARVTLGR
jgi:pimeloyl-ACP methyl ester carboxylesterase